MRRHAGGKKRDSVEPEIVAALRSVGAQVWHLSGSGLPDVLCIFRGRFFVMEIKSAGGRLTKAQAGIPWPVVRSMDEALVVIGASLSERVHGIARGLGSTLRHRPGARGPQP